MDRGGWWATVHGVTESDMTFTSHLLPVSVLLNLGCSPSYKVHQIKTSQCSLQHLLGTRLSSKKLTYIASF